MVSGIVFWTIVAFYHGAIVEIGNAYPTSAACTATLKDWYPVFLPWPNSNIVFDCWPKQVPAIPR
jgi:hypothetical protein